jgi:outer membrane biosynthesis protein TonB
MADAEKIVHDVAERVRELVSQAEERAAEIVRDAEVDAKGIRERAETEARERLDEVRSALTDLEGRLKGGSAEVEPGPVTVPEPSPPPVPEPTPEPFPEPTPPPTPSPTPEPVPEPTPPPDEGTPPSAGNGAAKSDDAVAARLVAMNMALDGAARAEIERTLADGYELDDSGALIDDVLAKTSK